MCGLLGGIKKNWNYEKGLAVMAHRGPDGKRIEIFDDFVLGFVRLAIRDLSESAMQPMMNTDKTVAIVFNGEIYDLEKVKSELSSYYAFKTTSDTEVILNAYLHWGADFIHRIDGMFAIAVYDKNIGTITLYRDRFGVKPLYYYYQNSDFCFASELKGITASCWDVNFQYDITALYDFFTYEYIPEPKSMYQHVYKLEPGCKVVYHIQNGRLENPEKYWNLIVSPYVEAKRNIQDVSKEIQVILNKSIKDQLVADVEVGTFLSGGIDSSIVTAATNMMGYKMKAFSIGFDTIDKYAHYDEREYAKILAQAYDIQLIQKVFTKDDLSNIYNNIQAWYDEPYGAHSCYPSYFLANIVKENGVSVVLTGDGGDEIFGGYTRYADFKERCEKKCIDNHLISEIFYKNFYYKKNKLAPLFLEKVAMYGVTVDWYASKGKRKMLERLGIQVPKDYDDFWYIRKYDNPDLPAITRAQYIDFHTYLPSVCLQKVDRATMQFSIEARVPFCSKEVVEYAFSLSEEERLPAGELKGALKNAYRSIVPESILDKRKKGFTYPPTYNETRGIYEFRKSIFDIFIPNGIADR